MNPASIIKLMSAKEQFKKNHPKFEAFTKSLLSRPIEEDTLIEITVTRPGEKPVTANLKVQKTDLEFLAELKELIQ